MRVFILAIDALEYDFIKPRPFLHLKQKDSVKVKIPKECMTIFGDGRMGPWTPAIWTSILTGKTADQHRVTMETGKRRWRNPLLSSLKSVSLINKIYGLAVQHGFFRIGLPHTLGFRRENVAATRYTFISRAKNPVVIHHPLESSVKWASKGRHTVFKPKEIIESQVAVFEKEKQETFDRIHNEWDLFLVYTKFLDIIGHLCWQIDRIIEKYYQMVDDFAKEIQNRLPEETSMLILSDHGMRKLPGTKYRGGEHSHHAFASFNYKISPPSPLKITDLYLLITERMGL